MSNASDFAAGWIDTSIHEFLAATRSAPAMYALITCLDSCFDLPLMLRESPALRPLQGKCKVIGKGILLSARHLLAAEHRQRIFFGFDEVWFFPKSSVHPKPKNVIITGPRKMTEESLPIISRWMRANHCTLGLGDGTGMNFCARLRGVGRLLVRALSSSVLDTTGDGRASA